MGSRLNIECLHKTWGPRSTDQCNSNVRWVSGVLRFSHACGSWLKGRFGLSRNRRYLKLSTARSTEPRRFAFRWTRAFCRAYIGMLSACSALVSIPSPHAILKDLPFMTINVIFSFYLNTRRIRAWYFTSSMRGYETILCKPCIPPQKKSRVSFFGFQCLPLQLAHSQVAW